MTMGRRVAICLACAAQFLVLLDFSASNIFAPEILRAISLGETGGFWLMGAFALPYGAFLLIGGRLSDQIGAINIIVAGVFLLVVGNLLCATADSAGLFLAARAIQGLAAALVSPASLAAVMRFGGDEKDKSLSIYGAVSSVGFSAGLIVGGLVGQYSGWRIFFAGAAVCSIAVLLPLIAKREKIDRKRLPSFKPYASLATASTLISLAIIGLSVLSDQHESMRSGWILIVIAAVGLALLFRNKPGGELAVVHRTLSRSGIFGQVLCACLIGAALAPMLVMLSVYQSTLMHLDILIVAIRFLPHGVTCVVVGYCLPKILEKAGPLTTAIGSLVCFTIGLLCFGAIDAETGYLPGFLPGLVLTGVGIVGGFVSIIVMATGSLPEDEHGMISALINVGDQLGAALGLAAAALCVSVLSGSTGSISQFPACLACLAVFPAAAALFFARKKWRDAGSDADQSLTGDVANPPVD